MALKLLDECRLVAYNKKSNELDLELQAFIITGLEYLSPESLATFGPWLDCVGHAHEPKQEAGQRYVRLWAACFAAAEGATALSPESRVDGCCTGMIQSLLQAASAQVCLGCRDAEHAQRAIGDLKNEVDALGLAGHALVCVCVSRHG